MSFSPLSSSWDLILGLEGEAAYLFTTISLFPERESVLFRQFFP